MERQQQWLWERERQLPQQSLPRLQEKEHSAEEQQREEGERPMNVYSICKPCYCFKRVFKRYSGDNVGVKPQSSSEFRPAVPGFSKVGQEASRADSVPSRILVTTGNEAKGRY